ncbi:MAG: FAD-binding oxidoreductase [Candidatus Hodarchaeales archaeon]|jgi:glycolate oxidase
MNVKIKEELTRIVGAKNVFTEKSQRMCYRFGNVTDCKLVPPDFLADYIIRVSTKEQVSKILKLANNYKIPVVVWGGGTDFSGANSPIKGGIVLDIKELKHVIVDDEEMYVTAGAGAVLSLVSEAAEKIGLFFPHEMVSQPSATVGGAIATNSFGFRSGKYGSIRNFIVGIEAVLPNGELIKTKPLPKTSTGYDLASLLTGSEGTLAVVTEATLKLFPKPETRKISQYFFWSFDDAYKKARKLHNKLTPDIFSIVEMDFLKYVESKKDVLIDIVKGEIPNDIDVSIENGIFPSILTIGFEGVDKIVQGKEEISLREIGKANLLEKGGYTKKLFSRHHEDFKDILDLLPDISLNKMTYTAFDFSIPTGKVLDFTKTITKVIDEFQNVYILGVEIYSSLSVIGIDILIPKKDFNYQEFSNKIYKEVLSIGGSISAVHGVGTRHLSHLAVDVGEEYIKFMSKIKKALDPQDILNPGKLGDINGVKNY